MRCKYRLTTCYGQRRIVMASGDLSFHLLTGNIEQKHTIMSSLVKEFNDYRTRMTR